MTERGIALARRVGVEEALPGHNTQGQERRHKDGIADPQELSSMTSWSVRDRRLHSYETPFPLLVFAPPVLDEQAVQRDLGPAVAPGQDEAQPRFGYRDFEGDSAG